ncbi:phage portal protein [Zhengella mangrovi]|uniref:Phage portal protein n=1 Tax=Zhengella mangrovi TaxID=1982044 RepID=A0A2G1QRT7_9HYPH|nr:phage portal protein [Zhengella mangrovi]PHP68191.1 phage portal protein [Zhengella mangrovi]
MRLMSLPFGRPSGNLDAGSSRNPNDDFWYSRLSSATAAGVAVTSETTLKLPVAWDCLNVLSDTAAALPFHAFERSSGAVRKRLDDHPIQVLFRDDFETRKQQLWDLAADGNWFAIPTDLERGWPTRLEWIPPSEVTVERVPNGITRYKIHDPGGSQRVLLEGEIWHIKRPPLQSRGLIGTSPISAGAEAIAAALAVQDYGARFFANDCTPPFVIEHPTHFSDKSSRENFLSALKRWWGGSKRHSPGILEYGMKLSKVGASNEEAQFLETRKELALEIARIWRMPPHKVGLMDKATFSNIEQQALEFVIDTMLPWLTMIERWYKRNLLNDRLNRNVQVEHNVGGLLRGDIKARYEAYAQARQWGWLSANDVRSLENMNPIDGGDLYLTPMNMLPAGTTQSPASAEILGSDGSVLSRLYGSHWARAEARPSFQNVINIEDYRDAA